MDVGHVDPGIHYNNEVRTLWESDYRHLSINEDEIVIKE